MNQAELQKWAIEEAWPTYRQLCETPYKTEHGPGARGEFVQAIIRLNPSESLREEILGAMRAQMIHRKNLYQRLGTKQRYEKHVKFKKGYGNRHGATWIRQRGYYDEIPSLMEMDVETKEEGCVDECQWEDCHQPAVTHTGHCAWHFTKVYASDKLKPHEDWLRANGLAKLKEETREQWIERCRQYCITKQWGMVRAMTGAE